MRHVINQVSVPVIAFLPAMVLLAGCTTTEQEAAYAERNAERMMQVYGPACKKMGYTPDSDPWRNCVIGMSQRDYGPYYYGYGGYYGAPYRYGYW